MNIRYLLALFLFMSTSVVADTTKVFEGVCGVSRFQVTAVNHGIPDDNNYSLSVVSSTALKTLFQDQEGGWFHAACLTTKTSKPLLVFQSYCGGSGCIEGKYGVIDPASLKLLLRPPSSNSENDKQLTKLLGYPAPHLGNVKGAFCCEK